MSPLPSFGGLWAPDRALLWFYPPTIADIPQYDVDASPQQVNLFRHFQPRTRGVNVFKLSDGTYVQDTITPGAGVTNTNIPYPIFDDDPGAPFARVIDFTGQEEDFHLVPFVIFSYYGGHYWPITQAEAARLEAAGFPVGICILDTIPVPYPNPVPVQ